MEGGSGRSKRLCSTWPYKRHRNFIDGTIYDIGSGSFPFLAIKKNDRILFFLFLIHPSLFFFFSIYNLSTQSNFTITLVIIRYFYRYAIYLTVIVFISFLIIFVINLRDTHCITFLRISKKFIKFQCRSNRFVTRYAGAG